MLGGGWGWRDLLSQELVMYFSVRTPCLPCLQPNFLVPVTSQIRTLLQAGTPWLLKLQKFPERYFLAPERSSDPHTFFRVGNMKIPACGINFLSLEAVRNTSSPWWGPPLLHVDCPITHKHRAQVRGFPCSCSCRGGCCGESQVPRPSS